MFEDKNAEDAMNYYVSIFPASEVIEIVRFNAGDIGPEGTIKKAKFSLNGQHIFCTDTPIKHGFGFTPSISFFVDCESEEEITRLSSSLQEGGKVYMPLGDYGFSTHFAWVGDRFGVTWQLNLA